MKHILKTRSAVALTAAVAAFGQAAFGQSAHADPQADALLRKAAQATAAAKTMTANATTRIFGHTHWQGRVSLMKPDSLRLALTPTQGQGTPRSQTIIASGKFLWDSGKTMPTYAASADSFIKTTQGWSRGPIDIFFNGFRHYASPAWRYAGTSFWDGVKCQILVCAGADSEQDGKTYHNTTRLYLGPDYLVRRELMQFKTDGSPEVYTIDDFIRNVKTGVRLTKDAFQMPAGMRPFITSASLSLLADGTDAPELSATDTNGKPVHLSDYAGKVVVLDFWATWCGPCRQSFPHTNTVAQKYQGKDVVVLAVNVSDSRAAFDQWRTQHPQYGALTFVKDAKKDGADVTEARYQVSGIPTQYVIGKTGKIVRSIAGYGGPTDDLEQAIQKAGG